MKVSLIIPAYNEQNTIAKVIATAKKVRHIDEIIVVDDGSTDSTREIAKNHEVKILCHKTNLGKGSAISTGIQHAKGEIIVFIDADLTNISPRKITALIRPILNDEADFTKATFTRARGRVTELTVKPLLKVILPNMKFSQPLSGQFAAKKEFLKKIKIDRKWGVDIQLLFEAFKNKLRITEVEIGKLIHKKQPLENLVVMSEQVIQTILEEAGFIRKFHKMVAFDLDKTLLQGSSIEFIAGKWGFGKELITLRSKYADKKINDYDITISLSKYFKGKSPQDVYNLCKKIKITKFARKVIERLKKRQYVVAIISTAYSPIVEYFAQLFEVHDYACPTLIQKDGIFTGEVEFGRTFNTDCCDHAICKREKLGALAKKFGLKLEECIAVGDGQSDKCMFEAAGLSISKGRKSDTDLWVKNLTEILVMVE